MKTKKQGTAFSAFAVEETIQAAKPVETNAVDANKAKPIAILFLLNDFNVNLAINKFPFAKNRHCIDAQKR